MRLERRYFLCLSPKRRDYDYDYDDDDYDYDYYTYSSYDYGNESSEDSSSCVSSQYIIYRRSSSSQRKVESDKYNAASYRNAEDFYDNNYADFEGYDDAETYYKKHVK